MKYIKEDTTVVFSEIPDEISLCINISNCPCHCPGCHSSYLAQDIGEELNESVIDDLISSNNGISCICFMGGDAEPALIDQFAKYVKEKYPNLKTAWYSGREELSDKVDIVHFDYIKVGPYIEEKGPLNVKSTNQRLYKFDHTPNIHPSQYMKDITYRFWK